MTRIEQRAHAVAVFGHVPANGPRRLRGIHVYQPERDPVTRKGGVQPRDLRSIAVRNRTVRAHEDEHGSGAGVVERAHKAAIRVLQRQTGALGRYCEHGSDAHPPHSIIMTPLLGWEVRAVLMAI